MSIENKFLYKLLDSKDWDSVVERGITEDFFTGSNRRAFRWIGEFNVKYGKLPDIDTFTKRFPEIELDNDCSEKILYYCDEVGKKVRQNKLVACLDKASEQISSGNIDECYEAIGKLLLEVNSKFLPIERADIGVNTEERYKEYEVSKATGGMTGYPIGIMPIDRQTGGMKDVDLFTFLAQSGKGKTFLLCLIAINLIRSGYKVLFLTKEMSPRQIIKRIDAMLAGVNYTKFKMGQLSSAEEEQYKNYLENIAPRFRGKLSVDLITNGVNECIAKVDSFKPQILLVDGGYLMSEGADPEDWKAVISVWKAFKTMSLNRKVPTIITSQLTDKNTVAYSTGLKQYCDGIWVMKQDEVQREAREISIENIKIRDGEHLLPFTMNWDISNPKEFGQVAFENFGSKSKGFLVKDEAPMLTKID